MKKILFAISFLMTFASSASYADREQCRENARRSYQEALDACDGGGGGGGGRQCVTAKTCAKEEYNTGKCIYYNEQQICGRYCATGETCKRTDYYSGNCIYYDTVAACGNNSCSVSKVCGREDYYTGRCIYFNESVSCN